MCSILATVLVCSSVSATDVNWDASFTETYESNADGNLVSFAVRTPPRVEGMESYPLVVVLNGGPRVAPSKAFPFFQVRPSRNRIWGYRSMSTYDAMEVIAFAKRNYPVDPDRVYLVGSSAGGSGAMHLASCHPDEFAAVLPLIAAGNNYPLVNFKNLPVAFHHGDRDWTSSVCNVRVQTERMQAAGCPTTLTEYPGAGHGVPGSHEPLVNWLFEQRRNRTPARLHHECEVPSLGRSYWLRIRKFEDPHRRARIGARIVDRAVTIRTENVASLSLSLDLLGDVTSVRLDDDDVPVRADYRSVEGRWASVDPSATPDRRPYEAGGAANLYQGEPLVVVYGTRGERTDFLRETANRLAAHGGPVIAATRYRFPLMADADLTDEVRAKCNLLLVGQPEENSETSRIASGLPLTIDEGVLSVDGRPPLELDGRVLSLLHPHPEHPKRLLYLFAPFTDDGRVRSGPQHFLPGSDGFDRISQPDLAVLDADRRVSREMQFDSNWRWLRLAGARTPIPDRFRERSALAKVCLRHMQMASDADFALWWGPADRGMWGADFNDLRSYDPSTYTLADFRTRHRVHETTLGSVSGAELAAIWKRWGETRELLSHPLVNTDALDVERSYRIHIPMDLYIKLSQRRRNLDDPKAGPPFSIEELTDSIFGLPEAAQGKPAAPKRRDFVECFGEQEFSPRGGFVLEAGGRTRSILRTRPGPDAVRPALAACDDVLLRRVGR